MLFRTVGKTLFVIQREVLRPGLESCLCKELETGETVSALRFERPVEAGEEFLSVAAKRDGCNFYTFCENGAFIAVFRYTEAKPLREVLHDNPPEAVRLDLARAILQCLIIEDLPPVLARIAVCEGNICVIGADEIVFNYLVWDESPVSVFLRIGAVMERLLEPVTQRTEVLDSWLASLYHGEFTDCREVYEEFSRFWNKIDAPKAAETPIGRLKGYLSALKARAAAIWRKLTTRRIEQYVSFRRMYVYKPFLIAVILFLLAVPVAYAVFLHPVVMDTFFHREEEANPKTEETPPPPEESAEVPDTSEPEPSIKPEPSNEPEQSEKPEPDSESEEELEHVIESEPEIRNGGTRYPLYNVTEKE